MQALEVSPTTQREGGNMGTVTINDTAIQDMLQSALAFSAQKVALSDGEEVLRSVGRGNCAACAYIRYALSKEIGEYLGSIDTSVRSVYAYEPEYATGVFYMDTAHSMVDRGINLIVTVDQKNHALDSIVASLEDAVREAVRPLLCPDADGSCYVLDVRVVDREELASRRGYGAMVSSIYTAPVKLWTRGDLA
jgi:hypothetical protein